MTIFEAVLLGIIEGLSEFLPISSTAHMILGAKLLNLAQSDFVKSFEIIIQLGAILAVVTIYLRSFFNFDVMKKVIIGFIPTAVFGLLVYKRVKEYLGDMNVILWSLFIGGIILIIFEMYQKRRGITPPNKSSIQAMTIKDSIIVGFFQCVAFIPGVSRSAATIIGGMSIGIGRSTIAEYSFLLAVPTMFAATGLDAFKNREMLLHTNNLLSLVVGFVVSYVVAFFAIKGFLSYVKTKDFVLFGVYRVIVALVFWFWIV